MEIKDLENYQLCLSGNYGAKLASTFKDINNLNQNTVLKNKKILEIDGCDIYITEDNRLDFYGYFDTIYKEEYLKKINEYIKRMIFKVEDKSLRDKIIEIANLDLSRNSSYHIFNIEILVACALRKPSYFFFIHTLLKEKYLYHKEQENFEFLIFSIYDANSLEDVNSLYNAIMENSCCVYDCFPRSRMYDLKSVANNINDKEVKLLIDKNMKLIEI